MKLQAKLLPPIMALTIIPLLVFGGISGLYLVDTTREQLDREMETTLATAKKLILTHFDHAKADLQLMAQSRTLTRYFENRSARYTLLQPALVKQLKQYQTTNPKYLSLKVVLPDGSMPVFVSDQPRERLTYRLDSPLFEKLQTLREGDTLTHFEWDPRLNQLVAVFAQAMFTGEKPSGTSGQADLSPAGYLTMTMALGFLSDLLDTTHIGKNGYLMVLDNAGQLLMSPTTQTQPSPEVLATLTQTAGKRTRHDSEGFMLRQEAVGGVLSLVAVVPESDVIALLYHLVGYFLLVLLSVILVVSLLVYQHVRKLFLEPIYHLRDTVRQIGEGTLDNKDAAIVRKDEFGELHRSIDQMRENLKASQDKVHQLAFYDELTGLPNRYSLKKELEASIHRAQRDQCSFAVVFVDLDDFKKINDSLGHDMGDLFLTKVANRIRKAIREDDRVSRPTSEDQRDETEPTTDMADLVARLGGDEFTLLLNNIHDVSGVTTVIKRLLKRLSHPIHLNEHQVTCSASIGIALYPQDGKTAHELLKSADLAMYEAKKGGKNHFEFFSDEMNAQVLQRLALESNLRKALNRNEFRLYYQPRIDVTTETIDGFEALIRWESPDLGFVPPNKFIPFAEESVLICEIGYWVLNNACMKIAEWVQAGYDDICVSVNISPAQIFRGDTLQMIKTALRVNQVSGRNLEIEITESGLLKDESRALEFLHGVRALGVRIALDDFGTGYSSLSYLRKLPIDVLKIDRSFVIDTQYQESADLLESIIDMAQKLSLKTVAEGVETEEHVQMLKAFHCDFIQGYYYARPLPEDEARTFMAAHYRPGFAATTHAPTTPSSVQS